MKKKSSNPEIFSVHADDPDVLNGISYKSKDVRKHEYDSSMFCSTKMNQQKGHPPPNQFLICRSFGKEHRHLGC